jgi:hypothetical protein
MIRTAFMIICIAFFTANAWAEACNNTDFRNFYAVVQHENAGNPNYIRFDKTPDNYSGFNEYCYTENYTTECIDNFGSRYELVATSGYTKEWSAAVCGRARQADFEYDFEHRVFLTDGTEFYAGPKVSFQYKGDDGKWRILTGTNTGNLASWKFGANATQKYRWKWFSDEPRQFRIVIERAMKYDEFDLIMDW